MKTENIVCGDIHNDFNVLNQLINRRKPKRLFVCGDFGYWEPLVGNTYQYHNYNGKIINYEFNSVKQIKNPNTEVYFCDGNHEHFGGLLILENNEVAPNVFYQPRGSYITLPDGRNIMFMGGAKSIDGHCRKMGFDYFPYDEVIKFNDLENLPDIKVDILISHTCTSEELNIMLPYNPLKNFDRSNQMLSHIVNTYKPKLHYFGHWHKHKKGNINDMIYTCLAHKYSGEKWWSYLP